MATRLRDMTTTEILDMFDRRWQKERNVRKSQFEILAHEMDLVTTMLDGWTRGTKTFKKGPIKMILDSTDDPEKAREFLAEVGDAIEAGL